MKKVKNKVLDKVVERIRDAAGPERIVLFGSRARGDARQRSDWDLLVIARSELPRHRRSAPLYSLLADMPGEFEVVVYTPEEAEEWSGVSEAFVTTALREGTVLYEKES